MLNTILVIFAAVICTSAAPQQGPKQQGLPKSSSSGGLGGLIGNIGLEVVKGSTGVALGPAPKGCSKYEIIVGMSNPLKAI